MDPAFARILRPIDFERDSKDARGKQFYRIVMSVNKKMAHYKPVSWRRSKIAW